MVDTWNVGARPRFDHIDGAPVQRGDTVRVIQAIDRHVHDVAAHVGYVGVVEYLEYSCGCGQHFPDSPMIGVRLEEVLEEFWPEEVALLTPHPTEA